LQAVAKGIDYYTAKKIGFCAAKKNVAGAFVPRWHSPLIWIYSD